MPLQVIPVKEQDIHPLHELEYAAFFQPNNPLAYAWKPLGATEALISWADAGNLKSMRENKNSHWVQVIDSETNEPLCSAHWIFHDARAPSKPPSQASVEKAYPPNANRTCHDAFMAMAIAAHGRAMGKRSHWHLTVLATHPRHERRGAGSLALKWGTDRADEDGLEVYLNSSPVARALYEKHGFVAVGEEHLNLRPYGVEQTYDSTSMFRSPKPRNA